MCRIEPLLSPGKQTEFEFHWENWLGSTDEGKDIKPEVEKLSSSKVICIYGKEQAGESPCPSVRNNAHTIQLPGGHFFDWNTDRIFNEIR